MHVCNQYREGSAKSIKGALNEANNDNLEWYLALTDSIIGMIKCADVNSLGNGNKEALEKVGLLPYGIIPDPLLIRFEIKVCMLEQSILS